MWCLIALERAREDIGNLQKRFGKMQRKIGLVFATSVVAMMALGVTYGLWFETLNVYGTVCTGTLDAQWSIHETWDTEPMVKDFSNITLTPGPGEYELTVTIDNGYPCIWYYAVIDLTNTGTIPWKIYEVSLISENFPGDLEFTCFSPTNGIACAIVPPDEGAPPERLCIMNGTQVHPGDSAWGLLAVHMNNSAVENTTYRFTLKVVVEQWNEWPMEPPAGFDSNEEWLASLCNDQ
jgi:hypothetical protein